MNPKPSPSNASGTSASLSNPAATPTGLGKVSPATVIARPLGTGMGPRCGSAARPRIARRWPVSESRAKIAGLIRRNSMAGRLWQPGGSVEHHCAKIFHFRVSSVAGFGFKNDIKVILSQLVNHVFEPCGLLLVACIQSSKRIAEYMHPCDPKGSEQQCKEFLYSDRRRSSRNAAFFLPLARLLFASDPPSFASGPPSFASGNARGFHGMTMAWMRHNLPE